MPSLRGGGGVVHELRSSKTLIGASPSKCDVVVHHSGVRDLHALLTLAPDKASATLVPFSATQEGVCYLNERTVPVDGAAVVHGDRIAFGSPDADSFTFELTGPSSQRTNNASRSSTASFRRALDALRGDRIAASPPRSSSGAERAPTRRPSAAAAPRTATASLASALPTKRGGRSPSSTSTSQLARFLLDASSDALLSEFVERKLRQTSAQKRAGARVAMEPPPSLSSSNVSSVRSQSPALEDSILDRSMVDRASVRSGNSDALADSFMSTGERNTAEIERLRLSQQLREVNSVRRQACSKGRHQGGELTLLLDAWMLARFLQGRQLSERATWPRRPLLHEDNSSSNRLPTVVSRMTSQTTKRMKSSNPTMMNCLPWWRRGRRSLVPVCQQSMLPCVLRLQRRLRNASSTTAPITMTPPA